MKLASLIFGIVVIIGMLIGFIPCLGWLNWFNIPLAIAGVIVSIIAVASNNPDDTENKGFAIAGVCLCGTAIFLGTIRLFLGAGIF